MDKQRPRIAVVDDEVSVRKSLRRLLQAFGFDVATFDSGNVFFYSLELQHPDCLILDLHMPGMNGLEMQRRLTQAGLRVPVIVITGHDEPQTRAQCLSAGAADYLRKPFNDIELLATIQRAMASARHSPKRTDEISGAVSRATAAVAVVIDCVTGPHGNAGEGIAATLPAAPKRPLEG